MKVMLSTPARLSAAILVVWLGFVAAPHRVAHGKPLEAGGLQESDADMGCCVLKAQSVGCTYTNRGYCRKKADELRVSFEFFRDKSCRDVGACPVR